MFNAKQMLDQLVQTAQGMISPQQTAEIKGMLHNPKVTGAIAGAGGLLAGLLFSNKTTRNASGKVVAVGGAAALGALALKAYRDWMANKNQSSDGNIPEELPGEQQGALEFDNFSPAKQEDHSRAMLTAIIAAAKADGQFDQREQQIIKEQTDKMNDPEAAEWVRQEINKPLDVDEIAALATSPELASEIYLASLIVIDEQNELEKKYLDSLAEKLKLEPQLRREIEQQVTTASLG